MVGSILVGLETAGFIGALFGYGAAFLLAYPVVVWLARRMGAWDPLHDLVFAGLGAGCAAFAMWINWESIRYLSLLGQ